MIVGKSEVKKKTEKDSRWVFLTLQYHINSLILTSLTREELFFLAF